MRIFEDKILTPVLLQRFALEANFEDGDGRHYALIQRNNGDLMSHHPYSPSLDPIQLMWAAEVLKLINKELHHDGAWVVCFTHPIPPQLSSVIDDSPKHWQYGRYCLIWLDEDGDPQFTQEWVAGENADFRTFGHVLEAGIVSTAQKCEASWSLWQHAMRKVIKPKEGQTYKRAQGQRAPSARH